MKALGVLESNWDPIRKKFARRLIEEQNKVLRSYFAQGPNLDYVRSIVIVGVTQVVMLDVYIGGGRD